MKKIMCLYLVSVMLLAENSVWMGIMDLNIDGKGRSNASDEIKKVDNVQVKWRIVEAAEHIYQLIMN